MPGSKACNGIMYFVHCVIYKFKLSWMCLPSVTSRHENLSMGTALTFPTCWGFRLIFATVFISNDKNVAHSKWVETHPAQLGFVYNTMGHRKLFQNMRLNQALVILWDGMSQPYASWWICQHFKFTITMHHLSSINLNKLLTDCYFLEVRSTVCGDAIKPIINFVFVMLRHRDENSQIGFRCLT